MSRIIRWSWRSVYALFVGVALTFGATQAFATTTVQQCHSGPEFLGTCPPYTDETCDEDCEQAMFIGGSCVGPCCVCFV